MIEFDYSCEKCGDHQTNLSMESFICDCGGHYRHIDPLLLQPSKFEPHYSHEVGSFLNSWKDAERKGKAKGLMLTQNNRRFVNECKNIKRNREDFIQESYQKSEWGKNGGQKYKPGKKVKADEATRSFIPVNR